jgi:hypothetical protein
MKKYVILLIMAATLGFTACSGDDGDVDPVIGTWVLLSVQPNTVFNPEGCGSDSTVRILSDNTLTATFYFQQNNCAQISGAGTWQKTGASSYTFVFPEIGEIEGTVTFPEQGKMVFTSENDIAFSFQLQL